MSLILEALRKSEAERRRGSAPDVAARQVADRLTAGLGQQFIVDNKGGSGGNVGAEALLVCQ